MASARVVDPLDPVADGEFSGPGRPQVTVIELDFQCRPEGFGCRVIPAHTGTADRAGQVVPPGESGQLRRGVLTATVGVKPNSA